MGGPESWRLESGSISVARRTTHELVLELLREKILSGEIEPGSHLVQSELAIDMDVSTTPVREALRDLAAEGLVAFEPLRGAVVHELSTSEFEEIYEARMLLEPMAARRAAARVTPSHLKGFEELYRLMAVEEHVGRWIQLNREFHIGIYEVGVSPRIAAVIRMLQAASMMYIGVALSAPGLLESANHGHKEILDALAAGDADAAAETTLHHLEWTMQAVAPAMGEKP